MNYRALVTESLKRGDAVNLLGVPSELLERYERGQVSWIAEYSMRFGELPSIERFEQEFPMFIGEENKNPLQDIYETFLLKRKNLYVRRELESNQEFLVDGGDPTELLKELLEICNQGSTDVLDYSTFDRTNLFKEVETVYTGIKMLDNATGGLQSGDLCYIYGKLGTGKSTFALWIVSRVLMSGKKILIVPNETRDLSVVVKLDAALAGFNPNRARNRKWTQEEKDRIKVLSTALKSFGGNVIISRKPIKTVAQVDALVKKHKPDLVLVDGVYLMSNGDKKSAGWESLKEVSRELKLCAMENEVPVVGIHQSTRNKSDENLTTEDIAYSYGLAQDADLLLALNKKDEEDRLLVETVKNRDNKPTSFFIKLFFNPMRVNVYGI